MADLSLTEHNTSVLSNLKPGDLVEFPSGVYSHWAVYIGNEEVVHLAGLDDVGSGAHTSASSFSIGGAMFSKAKVCRDNFWKVAAGRKALINNSKDAKYGKRALSPAEIVKNALSKLGDVGYNLLFSNCEHFATWCRYGISQSDQVEKVVTAVVGLATGMGSTNPVAAAAVAKNNERVTKKK